MWIFLKNEIRTNDLQIAEPKKSITQLSKNINIFNPEKNRKMNTTFIIIIGMLILSILAPFIALYAVSLIKAKKYSKHVQIQNRLFWACILGVLILEIQIRISGGSGSLVQDSTYLQSPFFKGILIAHIIGAVLTYIIWAIMLFISNRKYKKAKTLPGVFSKTHRKLGYATIAGLFYTGITAFIVCVFAFFI